MKKLNLFTLIGAMVLSHAALADEKDCITKEMTYANFYFYDVAAEKADIGQTLKDKIDLVESIGKDKRFKGFKVVDKSLNSNPSNYGGRDKLDINIGLAIEFETNFEAISILHTQLPAQNFSVSLMERETCQ